MPWIITKDYLVKEFPELGSSVGKHSRGWEPQMSKHAHAFKLYDDDGELYYSGLFYGDPSTEAAFAPLDWAMADSGCTSIKYKQKGKNGKWEVLNPLDKREKYELRTKARVADSMAPHMERIGAAHARGMSKAYREVAEEYNPRTGNPVPGEYGFTGVYDRSKEVVQARADEFRSRGYKVRIVPQKASGYERRAGIRKGMVTGYSLYAESRYFRDREIEDVQVKLSYIPKEKEQETKRHLDTMFSIDSEERRLRNRLAELSSKNPISVSELAELRGLRSHFGMPL